MKHALDLWSWQGRVTQRQILLAGLFLFPLKYGVDLLVSGLFHQPWNPVMYLSMRVSPLLLRYGSDPAYWWTLMAVALPFAAMGVSLSARRLRDAGFAPFWSGLFFLPFLHLAFFLILAVLPTAPEDGAGPVERADPGPVLGRIIPHSLGPAFLIGLAASLVVGIGSYWIMRWLDNPLGVSLFVGTPFGSGFITAFACTYHTQIPRKWAVAYGVAPIVIGLLSILGVGWEGVTCVVMGLPILGGMALVGALAGYTFANRLPLQPAVACLLILPMAFGLEMRHPSPPAALSVVSTVQIAAPPDVVWRHVIAFPPIDAPPPPIFALTAMPLEARIEGQGAGATRRCIFTNGTFVEPIQVWNAPRELTFGVAAQPVAIDPYLQVTRGQFLLTANPDGSTTLRGTTWYALSVHPAGYWRFWTETFLHAIHLRVLEHVKSLSEHPEVLHARAPELPSWMASSHATCACTRHPAMAAQER